jgi:uncharacterized damage-inducible protein DinB
VRRRASGEPVDPSPDADWPPIVDASDGAWSRDVERMAASHRSLAALVRTLDDEHLDARAAGQEYSVALMLRGVIEHGTYHGGQIALLKKA